MKVSLKNYRQSPRKVRPLAHVVRGKAVSRAMTLLHGIESKAAPAFQKLIKSALDAYTKQEKGTDPDPVINSVQVDEGIRLRRFRPRARGSAKRILRRASHITLELKGKKQEV